MSGLRRLYEPAIYAAGSVEGCYWRDTVEFIPAHPPLEGDVKTEVAIVGAGYAGLNAALALARNHGVQPLVLEAHRPGWGASGRNGGFCCLGGAILDHATLARLHGRSEADAFLKAEAAAIDHVDVLTRTLGIDIQPQPGGEVTLAHSARAARALQDDVQSLRDVLGLDCRFIARDELRSEGLAMAGVAGALQVPAGFGLNPLRYVLGLASAAQAAGAGIHGESPVTAMTQDQAGKHVLHTPRGKVTARHVLIATNGYSAENLPDWLSGRTLPVLSNITVTRPLTGEELSAQGWTSELMSYDSRRLLHYVRLLPGKRLMLGMRGGVFGSSRAREGLRAEINRHFDALFPALAHAERPWFWSGLVCLTGSGRPFAGVVPDARGLWAALGWHGNGVAMASYAGAAMAARIAGADWAGPWPGFLGTPIRRFPAGRLRRGYLQLAYALAGMLDGPLPRPLPDPKQ